MPKNARNRFKASRKILLVLFTTFGFLTWHKPCHASLNRQLTQIKQLRNEEENSKKNFYFQHFNQNNKKQRTSASFWKRSEIQIGAMSFVVSIIGYGLYWYFTKSSSNPVSQTPTSKPTGKIKLPVSKPSAPSPAQSVYQNSLPIGEPGWQLPWSDIRWGNIFSVWWKSPTSGPPIPVPSHVQTPDPTKSVAPITTQSVVYRLIDSGKSTIKNIWNNPKNCFALAAIVTAIYYYTQHNDKAEVCQDVVVGGLMAIESVSAVPLIAGVLGATASAAVVGACAVSAIPAAAAGRMIFRALGWEKWIKKFIEQHMPGMPFRGAIASFAARLLPQLLFILLAWVAILSINQYMKKRKETKLQQEREEAERLRLQQEREEKLNQTPWRRWFHKLPVGFKQWLLEHILLVRSKIKTQLEDSEVAA